MGSWGKKEGRERMVILVATRPPLHLTSGIVLLDGYVIESRCPKSWSLCYFKFKMHFGSFSGKVNGHRTEKQVASPNGKMAKNFFP